jgi:hypothetical protein
MAEAAMAVLSSPLFKTRIGDAPYAMRIGVQIVLDNLGASLEELGFGLWTRSMGPCDNAYGIIVIDVNTGGVYVTSNPQHPGVSCTPVLEPTEELLRKLMNDC